jgi:hypothetical protein
MVQALDCRRLRSESVRALMTADSLESPLYAPPNTGLNSDVALACARGHAG